MTASLCEWCNCPPDIKRPVAHDLGQADLFIARCPQCGVSVVGKDEKAAITLWDKLQEAERKDIHGLWQDVMRRYYAGLPFKIKDMR